MIVVCTALDLVGGHFARGALRALAATAVFARGGAPRLGPSHGWRDAATAADDLAAVWGEAELLGLGDAEPLSAPGELPGGAGPEPALPRPALDGLERFVASLLPGGSEPVLLSGFAAANDLAYLAWSYDRCGQLLPCSRSPLELRSLAMGALGLPWEEASPERLCALLNLPGARGPVEEGVVGEALLGALVLVQLLDRVRRRSASEGLGPVPK